jgi:hypothetical protein
MGLSTRLRIFLPSFGRSLIQEVTNLGRWGAACLITSARLSDSKNTLTGWEPLRKWANVSKLVNQTKHEHPAQPNAANLRSSSWERGIFEDAACLRKTRKATIKKKERKKKNAAQRKKECVKEICDEITAKYQSRCFGIPSPGARRQLETELYNVRPSPP